MADSELIHIRVGKGIKKQMQNLIDIGIFSTESEIAREEIRTLLIKYLRESGLDKEIMEAADKHNSNNAENTVKKGKNAR